MGGTLLQKQGDKWVVIGYHSKRLPKSAKNFGVTELELTGLLVNTHGFMQLLCNRYFEVLVDHKAIEYMIKSNSLKMEYPFINGAAPFSSILSCSVYKWRCSIFKQLCKTYNNQFYLFKMIVIFNCDCVIMKNTKTDISFI